MDANEKLNALKDALYYMEQALDALKGLDTPLVKCDIEDAVSDLNDEILDADKAVCKENREELDALTRSYFRDAIGALDRIGW